MPRRLVIRALAVLVPCLTAGAAWAQSLTVMPVVIQLQPGQLATTVTLSSQGDSQASFQVRAFAWRQDGNEDRLEPTSDLVLSPPISVIPANATQIVRLVLRRPPQNRESVYRILVDQIPPPAAPGVVRIALRLSMPIFGEPTTRVAPHVTWRIERSGEDAFLVAVNDGTRHERFHDIVLTAGTSIFRVDSDKSPYILAGATRRWRVSGTEPLPSFAELHLTAESDSGKINLLVPAGRDL
jgi:fimbrial chaperone protein